MTSWHEYHQYSLENGGMDDPDEQTPVFTHCNVCGKRLREPEEDQMGMCNDCGNME